MNISLLFFPCQTPFSEGQYEYSYNLASSGENWAPKKKKSQPGRAEISFIDQGEFVATKTLSGCKALCCDKHQFCDKMTVST